MAEREHLWDDKAFRTWVEDGALKQGRPVSAILQEAGVSRYYLSLLVEGRDTNVIMNLARILNQSPAKLLEGWDRKLTSD